MVSSTSTFFDELSEQGRLPMLARASGIIRFEIVEDEQPQTWTVAIQRGNIQVSRHVESADCVVRAPIEVFDGVVSGRSTAVAALLRGALSLEGDPELLTLAHRLFAAASAGRRP